MAREIFGIGFITVMLVFQSEINNKNTGYCKRKQLWRKMKNDFVGVDLLKVVLSLKSMEVI